MENYIFVNGQRIELTEEQIARIIASVSQPNVRLADIAVGDTVKIGNFEMVVLEQYGNETSLILKDLFIEDSVFGEDNNQYDGSIVDQKCQEFGKVIAGIVGEDNLVLHEVDLTSDDGLKDYGAVDRYASLITADMYRKYVDILDTVNPQKWWWLATPHSTKRHENDSWTKCVAPSGDIYVGDFIYVLGVRPFCILKSTIFVSG